MSNPHSQRAGFVVDVGCPACGGAVSLGDDFGVVCCGHCSSILRITMPDVPPAYIIEPSIRALQVRFHLDRHLKENGKRLSPAELDIIGVYAPYWKINSLMLRLRNRIETRIVTTEYGKAQDHKEIEEQKQEINLSPHTVTVSARPEDDLYPFSLGMRTEYVRLTPFVNHDNASEFRFLTHSLNVSEAFKRANICVQRMSDSLNPTTKRNISQLYGLRAELIYFPYYRCRFSDSNVEKTVLLDSVSGRIVGERDDMEVEDYESPPSSEKHGKLSIELHRCNNCGRDLPKETSMFYICVDCETQTFLEAHPLFKQRVMIADGETDLRDEYLPFWVFAAKTGQLGSFGASMTTQRSPDRIAIPAFRLGNFEAVYRVSSRLTTALEKIECSPANMVRGRIKAASVSVKEAVIIAQTVLARAELRKDQRVNLDRELDFQAVELVLIPFHPESYFFVDSVLSSITVEKRAMVAG